MTTEPAHASGGARSFTHRADRAAIRRHDGRRHRQRHLRHQRGYRRNESVFMGRGANSAPGDKFAAMIETAPARAPPPARRVAGTPAAPPCFSRNIGYT
ncbi:hypothetical protein [Burkholderia thailandensis]|uniref:Uncharacterized protein n=1 Tax=Burkholderia thailandensis TaxID=57975 RepID=A0AAW9CSU1_BURTH|nr:hypothetical protein [Burkholderia thailandensis]MCS3395258.1 hypothetical protein [Burkholderia thailandensis]MCS6427950.1 hypothetical protein [Burkholderia thailandensis]MCS6456621.1 hypothetical protein [Burkholderia thailandensis]MCS6467117.1 hypothetical protein [Burkholderia thailandensis]MCS6486283.1 hypothetical protein [Burkholderia thailandensis]